MAVAPGKIADEITSNVRSIIDRILDVDVPSEITDAPSRIAEGGRDAAGTIADAAGTAAERAADATKDAADAIGVARRGAASWSERTGRELGRRIGDLWNRRTVALSAAGAAVPASKELVESAAERLGLKRREERHWGLFFLGLLLGAAGGAIVAILLAPRPGSETRTQLAARAREASDWIPVFPAQPESEQAEGGSATTGLPAAGGPAAEDIATAGETIVTPTAAAEPLPPLFRDIDEGESVR